jgi:light-regulated signal transduction histidine kinase (bacteriophytochrome)
LGGVVILTIGLVYDALIDFGVNKEYVYISEYLIVFLVIMMSLHLTDELRRHALNLEARVAIRTEQLQQANRELESFTHSISHDLQAPLRAIQGFSTALDEESGNALNTESRDFLKRIINNTKRMDEMLDAMLYLSRMEKTKLTSSEVNISRLANEVAHELAESSPERMVLVSIEDNIIVQGDQVLLRIVLENLLRNAWKYTRTSQQPEISVQHYRCQNGRTGFVVSDNGIGFDKDQADKLFILFQRLHSNQDYPGLGIGLATVASIVKRHHGQVWAESDDDQGAAFYVCL